MKKLVRCHAIQIFIGGHVDRRGVGVLHSSAGAGSGFSDVQKKCVVLVGRAFHQLQFVLADARQLFFHAFLFVVVAVNHHAHRRLQIRQHEIVKFPGFHRHVRQRVVTLRIAAGVGPIRGILSDLLSEVLRRPPVCRHSRQAQARIFGAPLRHVQQNHRRIDERMLSVELRGEWPSLIPIRGVAQRDRPTRRHAPGLLVQLLDGHAPAIGKRRHLRDVTAEIADLIERVPGRHLHNDLVVHIGNRHGYRENMLFGVCQRNVVANRGLRWNGAAQRCGHHGCDDQQIAQRTGLERHRRVASAGVRTPLSNFFTNFSHKPSKLPLDITSSTSPGAASLATNSTIVSELPSTWASLPKARTLSATVSGLMRFSSPSCCARNTPPSTTRSASASDTGSVSSKIFRRMELDRGSSMAHSRRPGQRPRAASIVTRTAVGWCAKSSTTSTPPTSPFTSMRRFTLRNLTSASPIAAAEMPRPCATAVAAKAFNTLWRPVAAKTNSPKGWPLCATENFIPSRCGATSVAIQSLPAENPKVSTWQ